MRRTLIIALALSVAGLGPVPLSACALLSSKLAECSTPKTQSRCDQMDMDDSGAQVSSVSDSSCCSVSTAPLSQAIYNTSDSAQTLAPVQLLHLPVDAPHLQPLLPVPAATNLSPPPLRSLLCTFLI